MTDRSVRPVRISRPPMMIGISIFSAAIEASRAFSSARSGLPGAYVRLTSLIGWGTRRAPPNAAIGATAGVEADTGASGTGVTEEVDIRGDLWKAPFYRFMGVHEGSRFKVQGSRFRVQ